MFPFNQQQLLPITLHIELAGVRQEAKVLEDRSDDEAYRFLVRFQDGTEATFTEGSDTEMFADKPGLQSYADALLPDLFILPVIEPGLFYYILPYELEGKTINVWLIEQEPDQSELECIGVYYNQRARLEIYKDGSDDYQWRGIGQPLSAEEEVIAKDLTVTLEAVRSAIQR